MPKCNILENHACITVNGFWRPCCRFNEASLPYNDRMLVNDFSYHEYKSSPSYQEVRRDLKKGWHKGCVGCKVAEETGNKSTRLDYNERLSGKKNQIEFIEISLSNECNLSCKMCGPFASSSWNELVIDNPTISEFHVPWKAVEPINVKKVFDGMDLSKLKIIKLLGGEPFITPQTYEFFELLDSLGITSKVRLSTNTNATFFPKKMIKFLEKFKTVNLDISIEGIGKVNEYIRYPSKWDTFCKVVDQWMEVYNKPDSNFVVGFSSVINAYNVHQIVELHNYVHGWNVRLWFNIINGPKQLRLDTLPQSYINLLLDKYEGEKTARSVCNYLKSMKRDADSESQAKLKRYTQIMDEITGMSLYDVNYDLAKAMEL